MTVIDPYDPSDATPSIHAHHVRGAQVLIACDTIEPTLSFFVQRLGFRIDAIYPADDPRTALITGYGLRIRLARGAEGGSNGGSNGGTSEIELLCDDPLAAGGGRTRLQAPNGVRINLVAADPPMRQPVTKQSLVLSRAAGDENWITGRAGLRYRDLLPDRLGGSFIASHIRILEGGPVPDYVHFHKVRFQVIFCHKGWVRVAYEGLTSDIVMQAGDCVLQPPMIRHRVLESSAGAEVIEICTPAEHITMADHEMTLPQAEAQVEVQVEAQADRRYSDQRFVFDVAANAVWRPWRVDGFEMRDTGIGAATDGLGGVRVVRRVRRPVLPPDFQAAVEPQASTRSLIDKTEFCFYVVLQGRVTVEVNGRSEAMGPDDSISIPGEMAYAFVQPADDLEMLEVTLPARSA